MIDVGHIISALIAAIASGGGVGIIQARSTSRKIDSEKLKTDADAAALISETSVALLTPLRDEVERLRETVANAEVRVEMLTQQLDACGDENRRFRRVYGAPPAA